MSLLQDVTAASQPANDAASISSAAEARRYVRSSLDHAAERTHASLRGVWRTVAVWLRRRADRAMLRSFSPRHIHDFCPRHTEAEAEMNKPFWQA
jgi:uncharacterized protein YjiS (DUF1127 family)